MGFFRRAISRLASGGVMERARRAEASGRLEAATALYLEAGDDAEVARLFELRAEAAAPKQRLTLLAQAIPHLEGAARHRVAVRHARLSVDLARAGELRLMRSELIELGEAIERLDEPGLAAEAFAMAGDEAAQTRALIAAGMVDRLESVLATQQQSAREARRVEELFERCRTMELIGRRRSALECSADEAVTHDERAIAVRRRIVERRLAGPTVRVLLGGDSRHIAFGDNVIIGRSGATVNVSSPAISRSHLSVRRQDGRVEVLDLGSSNGTLVRGARLDAVLPVGAGIELSLGGEVPISIRPVEGSGRLSAVNIAVAGQEVLAPLGPLRLASCDVDIAEDEWVELKPLSPMHLGDFEFHETIQLCRGDVITEQRGGRPVLEVPT